MKCNVGKTDKVIRLILGLAIIATGIYYGSWLGVIGLMLIATAVISWCPAYLPFGLSTIKK